MTALNKTSLLHRWKNRNKTSGNNDDAFTLPKGVPAPMSLGQRRLWFLQQLYPDNPFYHYSEKFKFYGNLNLPVLVQSLGILADRHNILRTNFEAGNGKTIQKINKLPQLDIRTHDLRHFSEKEQKAELEKITKITAETPFDLSKDALTRIAVLRLNELETEILVCTHHIISDNGSMQIFGNELGMIYQALTENKKPDLSPLPVQYADFAFWQNNRKPSETSVRYWEEKLSGELPNLNLRTDFIRPVISSFRGGHIRRKLSPELAGNLKTLAKSSETTLFVLLLAAYKILLFKYTNQKDLLAGTPVINRDRQEFENLIGFFNNTLVLRSRVSESAPFSDFVHQVRNTTLEALSHKNVPFENIVKTINPDRFTSANPIFQTMFLLNQIGKNPSFGNDLEVEQGILNLDYSKFDLTLFIFENGDNLSFQFEYSKDLFEAATIERMASHFNVLLENIAQYPQQPVSEISLLSDTERALVVSDWNNTNVYLPDIPNIHFLIEKQARENPDKIAVVFENQSLTYRELNKKAETVAAHLLKAGIRQNSPVGLCMERSVEMIIGILGILKAGGAYLPLDPKYPSERIDFMTEDSGADFILTQEHLIDNFFDSDATVLGIQSILRREEENRPKVSVENSDSAYVIYTSGSTGKPKGVSVTHQNLIHSTVSRFEFYSNSPNAFLLLSSFSFDSSVVGIFWTLCTGGTLVVPKHRIEQNLDELGDLIQNHQISHTLLLPSLYSVFLQNIPTEKMNSLDTVIVAGEACSTGVCKLHFEKLPDVALYNEYGPTEASVWCTAHQISREDLQKQIPVGKPIPNTQNYILDKNLQPVPIGIAGDLYIGGDGVTEGYLNRPELTAERFISNPFIEGEKLYKTGDLARWRTDGIIDFLGRADNQVKIRGHRIELNEIQKVIQQHPDVEESLVLFQRKVIESDSETDETTRLTELILNLEESEAEKLLNSIESLSDENIEMILENVNAEL